MPTSPDPARRGGHRSQRRTRLLEELEFAGRTSSAATVMFHAVVAERLGLSAAQEKTLDLLARFGAATPGQLAARSGLAPATVTGIVDALEQRGFVRRTPNPSDGRSILVELEQERVMAAFAPLYADWIRALDDLYEGYTDEQLETIAHFLTEAAARQQQITTELTGGMRPERS